MVGYFVLREGEKRTQKKSPQDQETKRPRQRPGPDPGPGQKTLQEDGAMITLRKAQVVVVKVVVVVVIMLFLLLFLTTYYLLLLLVILNIFLILELVGMEGEIRNKGINFKSFKVFVF